MLPPLLARTLQLARKTPEAKKHQGKTCGNLRKRKMMWGCIKDNLSLKMMFKDENYCDRVEICRTLYHRDQWPVDDH